MYIAKTKISYPITLASDEPFIRKTLGFDLNENEDNDFVNDLIESAIEQTEGLINQDIAYTNNIVTLDDFSGCDLVISQGNLNTITNIINNDSSTLITGYTTKKGYTQFTISFDPDISAELLTINFTTGWNNIDNVPKGLKQAIICKTADLYDKQRSSYGFSSEQYNSTWENLCQQYKLL